jgi:hypothetical protein
MFTKDKKVVKMSISIEDYLVYNIREYFRFVIIKNTEQQTFGNFSVNTDKTKDEEKHLKMIFDYFECQNLYEDMLIEKRTDVDEGLNQGSQWRPTRTTTVGGGGMGSFLIKKMARKLEDITEQYYEANDLPVDEKDRIQESCYQGTRQFLTHRNKKSNN